MTTQHVNRYIWHNCAVTFYWLHVLKNYTTDSDTQENWKHAILNAADAGNVTYGKTEVCSYELQIKGWDSSVGIATYYGLGGLGIKSWWGGHIFHTGTDQPWGPFSLLYKGYRVFPRCKAAGAWHWPPTPSSAEVKKEYLYSLSGPSRPVLGWPLPLWSSNKQKE
jgi:hypothetical protein